jgi:DDE family transposase
MSKKDFSVRNWRLYNQQLIKRGDLTCWIDAKSWHCRDKMRSKRGRPHTYDNNAIVTMLVIKRLYRLTLRSCQGFVESLVKMANLDIKIPNYTTVCRRQNAVTLPKLPTKPEPLHLVIDSSGLKIFGEGEWKVRQHGYSKHRMWTKLHIGVDEKSQLIVTAILTSNSCGDDKILPDLLDKYKGSIKQVSLDGAYDSHACYEVVNQKGAKAVIPPQPNPRHKPKTIDNLRRPRDFMAFEVQEKGLPQWKRDNDYHRRSLAETGFFRYKKILGDKLSARRFDNQVMEALIGCHILNKMKNMKEAVISSI